eukprot:Skav230074  [mRNA]  locus=scaffold2569:115713:128479:+ [translate_table: standard]
MLQDSLELEDSMESKTVQHAKAAAEAAGLDMAKLNLTIDVEAPILRLETWQDGAALDIRLGYFSGRSVREVPETTGLLSREITESEAVHFQRFALICELQNTQINLIEPGKGDQFIYEPTKVVLVAARRPHGHEIHTESTRFRCHIDPGLMRLLGNLQVGLDFALAPLWGGDVITGVVEGSPKIVRSESIKGRSEQKQQPWKFNLRTGSFDLVWDPEGSGGNASVSGHIAGVNLKVNMEDDGKMTVLGHAQDANVTCGDRRLLSSSGLLTWDATWSSASLRLSFFAPPLQLRWANDAMRKALAANQDVEALREALKMRLRSQLEELTQPAAGRGFLFSLRWTGALMVDAGFTSSSMLAREAVPRHINFQCHGGCVKDARSGFAGLLIDLPCADGQLGLEVQATMPAVPSDFTQIKIDLRQPNVWLLPQLWTDLLTWALSVYQQTEQAAVDPSSTEQPVVVQVMQVNLENGAVRLPISWDSPGQHFALVGDVLLRIKSEGSKMAFENLGTRVSIYRAEMVKLHRFQVRITLQDILELSDALQAMAVMEAESMEPQEEIRQRDPLSLEQPQKMSCALTSVDLSWAQGSTPMGCVSIEEEGFWLRLAALNERLATWEPILGTSHWNLKIICYETGPKAGLKGSQKAQISEAKAEIHAAPKGPIELAVTIPVIHSCSRLLQAYDDAVLAALELKTNKGRSESFQRETEVKRFEDLVVGINLTGMDCLACRPEKHLDSFLDSTGDHFAVELSSKPISLDLVLDNNKRIDLQLKGPGFRGCPAKSLKVQAGVAELWETSQGRLLVQVLVTKPPQLLLLVSSPMILANRTLLDLEVKLSHISSLQMEAQDWPPFCIPIDFLDHGSLPGSELPCRDVTASSAAWKKASEFVESHTLWLPSGFVLALPPQALETFEASFQLRPAPASVGGMHYSWGGQVSPLRVRESDDYVAYSRSVCNEVSMPPYGLRLTDERKEILHQISIEAPFLLCNACPVSLSYHLLWSNTNTWSPTPVGTPKTVNVSEGNGMIHICDGYGGIWDVPPNGFAYLAPLRLNENRFQWQLGKNTYHQECPHTTNLVTVKRDGRKVCWTFLRQTGAISKQAAARLNPGDEVPIYDLPEHFGAIPSHNILREALHRNAESLPPLLLSVSLSDGRSTRSSLAIPVLVEGQMSSVPVFLGPGLTLQCDRQNAKSGQRKTCKAIIYGNCWFNNATGLDVCLVRGVEPAKVFNNLSVMDDEAWANVDEDDEDNKGFYVVLVGTQHRIRLPFVGVGQSAKLRLSPTHDCILKSEFISSSSSHGVSSTLVTLIPGLLAFNLLDFDIGFRQDGGHGRSTTWIQPSGARAIYWSFADGSKRKLQLTLRGAQSRDSRPSGSREGQWSAAFEVSEHGIGCFPIRLPDAALKDHLFCVQIQQCTSQLITLTLTGPDDCHQLVNRHPCLVVDGSFTDELMEAAHFVAVHGAKVPFGFSGVQSFNRKRSIRLVLGDVASEKFTVKDLPLDVAANFILDDFLPISVRVDIVQRVAKITISPVGLLVGLSGDSSSLSWSFEANVRIPALNLGLRGGQTQSAESFCCQLRDLSLHSSQHDGIRESICELSGLQIDHVQGKTSKRKELRSVALASLRQPKPWRLEIIREQLNESDAILQSMNLQFFPTEDNGGVVLESNVSEELIKDIKEFLRDATPLQLEGLCLFQISRWAGRAYHETLEKPPSPARKYVLKGFDCGNLKIGLWCRLSFSNLPSFVGAMLSLSSLFSSTLDVDGARLKLERQRLFAVNHPFEGTLEALANLLVERYKPCIRHSWRSLLNNSNAFLGGMLTRHAWNPRIKKITTTVPPVLCVWNGVVYKKEPEVPLDEQGFQQILKSRDIGSMENFLRRRDGVFSGSYPP